MNSDTLVAIVNMHNAFKHKATNLDGVIDEKPLVAQVIVEVARQVDKIPPGLARTDRPRTTTVIVATTCGDGPLRC